MGLGNGMDDAPPGVTEDQPHFDERVGDAGDDALETDFFLMDSEEGGGAQGSWTEITESDESMSAASGDIENGWAEAVESDPEDMGKGQGRGKGKGHDEGEEAEGVDNLDAFDQDTEDFPDQADW